MSPDANGLVAVDFDEQDITPFDELPPVRVPPRLIQIERDQPHAAKYMDWVSPRIIAFSQLHQGTGQALMDEVWLLFAQKSRGLGLWVVVDENEQLVGHALATVLLYDGRPVGWVHQVEIDFVATAAFKQAWIQSSEQWLHAADSVPGLKQPLRELLMVSARGNDAWARHAGFVPYRTIFRREV